MGRRGQAVGRAGIWTRRALLLALLVHGLAGAGSVADKWAGWDGLRRVTSPYERLVGATQSWNMFAPNAPSSSRGLEVAVLRSDGEWTVVSPSYVPARPGRSIWYRRMGKVERNLLKDEAARRREVIARHLCATGTAEGPVFGVRMVKVERKTPLPGATVLPGWQRELLTESWCRP